MEIYTTILLTLKYFGLALSVSLIDPSGIPFMHEETF